MQPTAVAAQTLQDWPQPSTVKEVQGFLGFVNFYRQFIPNVASIAFPFPRSLVLKIVRTHRHLSVRLPTVNHVYLSIMSNSYRLEFLQ